MENGVHPNLFTKVTLMALLLLSGFATVAQNQVAKQSPAGTWYLEYLPPDYNLNSNNYPIMIFCHGIGERGDTQTSVEIVARNGPPKHVKAGYKFPFILISPQLKLSYNRWPTTYVDEVLEYAKTYLRVDVSRIYLCGLSLGGGAVWDYAQDPLLGQKLAAIVPVCGGFNNPKLACNFGITNLPVWAFHGDKDTIVPLSRSVNMVNAINACVPAPNPLAKMTIYAGIAHDSWSNAYRTDNLLHTPNVYQWLAQFKNGTATAEAGPNRTITLPTNSLTITGSGSVQGATITSYQWSLISGVGGTMSNTTSATVSITGLSVGLYSYRLVVKASNGEMAQDIVQVTVKDGNSAPVANAGPDINITLPTNSVTVNGSGSDVNGSVSSYLWTKVSGPTATASGTTTATLNLSSLLAGTYVYSLKVTDNAGATGTDNVTITVNSNVVNQVPTVNAGLDKTIQLPTNTLNLTATATDPDGTIASYLWEKASGPAATMANTTNPTVSLSALVAGTYVFKVTVTDNSAATASDQVTVLVTAANQSPVANAGPDLNLTLPTNSTNIVGAGSDPDGSIATYTWTVRSGPNAPTVANASSATVSISNLIAGTYVLRLTVADNSAATAFDDVTVVVNAAIVNIPPVANAGGDKIINLPTNSTSLAGSGSSDPDGSIASYSWTQTSGAAAILSNATSPTVLINNLVAGVYKFTLTVTDNTGATDTDEATVTVEAVNQSPLANAGADASITLPTNTAVLNGSGSDPDGSIASYLWEKLSGPSGGTLANQSTPTLTISGLVAGTYIFSLTVTDDKGFTDSDEVTLVVNDLPVNSPPTANAGANKSISLPTSSIILNGSGLDTDGTIASYAWILVTGPVCTLADQNTKDLSLSNLQAGSYIFRLTVKDNLGAEGSDEMALTVQPEAVNQSPVANAGADKTLTLPVNSTNLVGSGNDPDGSIASYAWTKLSGPAATLGGETTSTLNLSGLVAGTYSFRLTVTDDKGSTGSDLATVIVSQTNQPPVANAGADITIELPTNNTIINGSGTDADGTIITYAWRQVSGPTVASLFGLNLPTLTVSNLFEGTYTFAITVTDDDGSTAEDQVKVIVNSANLAPSADAGSTQTITLPTNTANFNGSGTDTDGSISSYVWTQLNGPETATLSNPNTPNLTVGIGVNGTYTFRLTVTDNEGATAYDDVQLVVNAAAINQAPIANAGTNQSITLPTNFINLTGSGSDQDGAIVSYAWVKVSGPAATLSNANSATVSISGLVEGNYVFRLTVTDDGVPALSASAQVSVSVFPQIVNTAPVASAGPDLTLSLPTNSININGTAADTDGSIASYSWTKVNGPAATLSNQTTPTLTLNGLIEGTYTFRLTVTDNDGATGVDDVVVQVNALAVNQAPVANAGPNITISLPQNTLTINGVGTDADGSITEYRWTKSSGPTVTMNNTNTKDLSLLNLVAGTYVFRLRVTDNAGATATDAVQVIVQPETVNQIPVADAGVDQTIILPTNFLNLFGSGSDPDGGVVTYAWTKLSGPAATLVNPGLPTLSVTGLVQGTYVFRLVVTDNEASIDADEVTVIVNALGTNQPPLANAGPDQSVILPTNIAILEGSGSDNDGSIATYAWLKVSGPAITLGATNGANMTVTGLIEGTYVFRLTVTDNGGASHFDEATVTVIASETNAAPVVSAGADITIFEPETSASLDATANDADGTVATILWTQIGGAAAMIATPETLFTQVTGLTPGTYTFRVSVSDDDGSTTFDEVNVTVETVATNQPPFANAGIDQVIQLPTTTATLEGSGADADGTIASYLWQLVSGPTVTLANATTPTLTLTNLIEGIYIFSLTVTDDDGATFTDEVRVDMFNSSVNLPPLADAGSDVTVTLPTSSITLTGVATDEDTAPPGVLWQILSGPDGGTLTNETQPEVTLSNLVEGIYLLRFTVTDAGLLVGTDDVTVIVVPEPLPTDAPVVSAGDDVEIQLPQNAVSILASAESPQGLIVSYNWEQISGQTATIVRADTATVDLINLVPGAYGLIVTVMDSEGREASDEVNITVLEENQSVRPRNMFSPDQKGDPSTETWAIENVDMISDCEILVYDRQGQKVFSSIGYPVPWDGTFNGKPVPDGAYFYVIRCGGEISKTGSVTIARLK
jgi:gliding motility-associated-like protein